MKKTRKILAIALALLMVMALMAGCAKDPGNGASSPDTADPGTPAEGTFADRINNITDVYGDEEIRIAYIPLSTLGTTNSMIMKAFDEFLVFYDNVKVEAFEVTYDTATQISTIQECITQGFKGIIMEATDAAALADTVEDAEEAGIPVMTINCGCEGIHSAHFEGNDYDSGALIAKNLVDQLGGKGKVIVLDCPAEQVAFSRMGTGFVDYVEANCPDIELTDHQFIPNWSRENANTTTRDLLTKYAEIDAVYGVSDDIALGALQAIEATGRDTDGILIWGRSGYPDAFAAIKEGRMTGTCYEDYYQEASAMIASMLHHIDSGTTAFNSGYTETPTVGFPLYICTQENVDECYSTLRWDELQ